MLFDSHNHLQSNRFGKPVVELVAEIRAAEICGCVVNATRESEWNHVATMSREFPGLLFPAYGIHPWFADTAVDGWQDRLRGILDQDPLATVGEVGVDRWVDSPSIRVQHTVFVNQAEIAAEYGRVMTVHCLKAWEELFSAMDQAKAWPEKFLMHSFAGSIEVAKRLLKHGAWFSFSGYFLHDRKAKVWEVFKQLPRDRILLETDAPDMLPPDRFVKLHLADGVNHPANLGNIAKAFECKMGAEILAQVRENEKLFWGL